eukprot:Rmarinus@m.9867
MNRLEAISTDSSVRSHKPQAEASRFAVKAIFDDCQLMYRESGYSGRLRTLQMADHGLDSQKVRKIANRPKTAGSVDLRRRSLVEPPSSDIGSAERLKRTASASLRVRELRKPVLRPFGLPSDAPTTSEDGLIDVVSFDPSHDTSSDPNAPSGREKIADLKPMSVFSLGSSATTRASRHPPSLPLSRSNTSLSSSTVSVISPGSSGSDTPHGQFPNGSTRTSHNNSSADGKSPTVARINIGTSDPFSPPQRNSSTTQVRSPPGGKAGEKLYEPLASTGRREEAPRGCVMAPSRSTTASSVGPLVNPVIRNRTQKKLPVNAGTATVPRNPPPKRVVSAKRQRPRRRSSLHAPPRPQHNSSHQEGSSGPEQAPGVAGGAPVVRAGVPPLVATPGTLSSAPVAVFSPTVPGGRHTASDTGAGTVLMRARTIATTTQIQPDAVAAAVDAQPAAGKDSGSSTLGGLVQPPTSVGGVIPLATRSRRAPKGIGTATCGVVLAKTSGGRRKQTASKLAASMEEGMLRTELLGARCAVASPCSARNSSGVVASDAEDDACRAADDTADSCSTRPPESVPVPPQEATPAQRASSAARTRAGSNLSRSGTDDDRPRDVDDNNNIITTDDETHSQSRRKQNFKKKHEDYIKWLQEQRKGRVAQQSQRKERLERRRKSLKETVLALCRESKKLPESDGDPAGCTSATSPATPPGDGEAVATPSPSDPSTDYNGGTQGHVRSNVLPPSGGPTSVTESDGESFPVRRALRNKKFSRKMDLLRCQSRRRSSLASYTDSYSDTEYATWKRRHNIPVDAKVFLMASEYPEVRRALLARGWKENTKSESGCFDLVWGSRESIDFSLLKGYQIANHFESQGHLCSKSGLNKHLQYVQWHNDTASDTFYPRSYFFHDNDEMLSFLDDYFHVCAESVLKRFAGPLLASTGTDFLSLEAPQLLSSLDLGAEGMLSSPRRGSLSGRKGSRESGGRSARKGRVSARSARRDGGADRGVAGMPASEAVGDCSATNGQAAVEADAGVDPANHSAVSNNPSETPRCHPGGSAAGGGNEAGSEGDGNADADVANETTGGESWVSNGARFHRACATAAGRQAVQAAVRAATKRQPFTHSADVNAWEGEIPLRRVKLALRACKAKIVEKCDLRHVGKYSGPAPERLTEDEWVYLLRDPLFSSPVPIPIEQPEPSKTVPPATPPRSPLRSRMVGTVAGGSTLAPAYGSRGSAPSLPTPPLLAEDESNADGETAPTTPGATVLPPTPVTGRSIPSRPLSSSGRGTSGATPYATPVPATVVSPVVPGGSSTCAQALSRQLARDITRHHFPCDQSPTQQWYYNILHRLHALQLHSLNISTARANAAATTTSQSPRTPNRSGATLPPSLVADLADEETDMEMAQSDDSELMSDVIDTLVHLRVWSSQFDMNGVRNAWIVKPAGKSRGRGIECFSNLIAMMDYTNTTGQFWVAQKYIETPLLIKEKKFDIRQWVLVTSWNPLVVWFYDENYLRFCCRDFSLDTLGDRYVHLANNSVQKYCSEFGESEIDGNMWDRDTFVKHLEDEYGSSSIYYNHILPAMQAHVLASLKCAQEDIETRSCAGEVFGYDFMVDRMFNVMLIEVNCSPSMEYSSQVTTRLCAKVLEDTIRVMIEYSDARKEFKAQRKHLLKLGKVKEANALPPVDVDTGGWQLLYEDPEVPQAATSISCNFVVQGTPVARAPTSGEKALAGGVPGGGKDKDRDAKAGASPLKTAKASISIKTLPADP